MNDALALQLKSLPTNSGVYQFFDKTDKILYVGKAKNLKKRVTSYFQKDHDSGKLRVLVKKINRLETIIVPTEFDALILENNLIKELQPRYNSMLKDDKTFPWICIKKEPFSRIFLTRTLIKDGSEYFGPYTSVKIAKNLLELIKSIYPLRTCSLDLKPSKISQHKYKVCLEYHLGNCLGPCEGYQTEGNYHDNLEHIREIIKGNFNASLQALKKLMFSYAGDLQFEKAHILKGKIELLEKYQAKSTVVNPKISNVDVFGMLEDEDSVFINYFKIMNGAIVQSWTTEWENTMDESNEELFERAIYEIRTRFNSSSKQLYLSHPLRLSIPDLNILVPKIGDKKHIVDLSVRNAKSG